MHNTTAPKNNNVITGKINVIPNTGHVPHRGGAGKHKHKNDKRNGNRKTVTDRSIREYD